MVGVEALIAPTTAPLMIADRGADADHARLIFLVVDRVAVAAHVAQRLDQRSAIR